MNRLVFISLLIFNFLPGYPQYLGGNEDGFSYVVSGQIQVNEQDFYCSGGINDGFFHISSVQAPLNNQEIYCSGGDNDGFSKLALNEQPMNNQLFYCTGGSNDGFHTTSNSGYFFNPALCYSGGMDDGIYTLTTGNTHFFNQAFYLSGGVNDGFSILNTGPDYICDPSVYVSGGINDGFAAMSPGFSYICNPILYSSGGIGDGFHYLAYSGPIYSSPAWLGGIADGFSILQSPLLAMAPTFSWLGGDNDGAHSLQMPSSYFGQGIWLGAISSSWDEPSNWSLNYIPDLTVNVLIAAGRSHYPLITSGNLGVSISSGSHNCLSLTIREGGSLFNKTNLYIDGNVTISGLYQADGNANSQVFVNSGGNLKLVAPGQLLIGNP